MGLRPPWPGFRRIQRLRRPLATVIEYTAEVEQIDNRYRPGELVNCDWPTGRPADRPTGRPADRPTGRTDPRGLDWFRTGALKQAQRHVLFFSRGLTCTKPCYLTPRRPPMRFTTFFGRRRQSPPRRCDRQRCH